MLLCVQGGLCSVLGHGLHGDQGLAVLCAEEMEGHWRSLRDGWLRAFGLLVPWTQSIWGDKRVGFTQLPWSRASVWFKINFLFSEVKPREDSFPFQ